MAKRAPLPLVLTLLLAGPAATAAPEPVRRPEGMTEKGVAALDRGLAWLLKTQRPDGSWGADPGYKLNNGYIRTGRRIGHVGITALAGMALLAGGPKKLPGPLRRRVEAAAKFVVACQAEDGGILKDGTRMYSHGYVTHFLVLYYARTRDESVKVPLHRAAQFIWRCQDPNGGWGYAPYDRRRDITVTVVQIHALQAARYAGVDVPLEAVNRGIGYVLRSAVTEASRSRGGFRYEHREQDAIPSRKTFATTAAGLASLIVTGLGSDEEIRAWCERHAEPIWHPDRPPPRVAPSVTYLRSTYESTVRKHYFFYFGNLYAVQALYAVGGTEWEKYYARVQRDLVEDQTQDGSWPTDHVGRSFSTACACLILAAHRIPPAPITKQRPAKPR